MPDIRIILTGCDQEQLQRYAKSHAAWGKVRLQAAPHGHKLVCTLPAEQLQEFYGLLEAEALHGWQSPDDEDVLDFDSAYFPHNQSSFQPMRQLRGRTAALRSRRMNSLPAARAVPRIVFGTEDSE
jgi:hypothetical protein